MTRYLHTTPRRARRGGIAASLLLAAAAVLAGCSAANNPAAESVNDMTDARVADWTNDAAYGQLTEFGGDVDYSVAEAPAATGSSVTQQSTVDRSVIVTGCMYMTVEDPIAAADQAADLVRSVGGRIDSRNETAPSEDFGGSAWLTLRIPSDQLDAVIDALRGLGTVDQFTTNSYDVTNEVADLEIEISTLRASTARIEALLATAKDLYDIITLEDELDRRQARLESLEAQQRGLDDQVTYSTLNLSLSTEPIEVVPDDDTPQNFWDGLADGWSAFVGFLSGLLTGIGLALPWIGLAALIALPVVFRIRRARKASAAAKSGAARRGTAPAKKPAARK